MSSFLYPPARKPPLFTNKSFSLTRKHKYSFSNHQQMFQSFFIFIRAPKNKPISSRIRKEVSSSRISKINMIIPVLFFYSILVYMSRLLLLICVLSCLSSALVINSPEERIYYHQRGSFANFITNTSIHNSVLLLSSLISLIVSIASLNATVVLADPIYACEPLKINATGKFVLAKRNDDLSPTQCTFATKVKNVWSLNSSICCRFVQSCCILSNTMSMFFKCPFILIE